MAVRSRSNGPDLKGPEVAALGFRWPVADGGDSTACRVPAKTEEGGRGLSLPRVAGRRGELGGERGVVEVHGYDRNCLPELKRAVVGFGRGRTRRPEGQTSTKTCQKVAHGGKNEKGSR